MDARALPNEVFTGAISLQDTDLHNGRGVDASGSYSWPPSVEEDMFFDWSALYGTQDPNIGLIPGERSSSEWSGLDFLSFDAPPPPLSGEFGAPPQMTFNEPALSTSNGIDSAQSQTLLQAQPQTRESPIVLPGFNNVAQWLDGAYRPSKPCDNCRRHRLQCLILRRTADNPNPVPSCSSCVGLFRPCSFGCGEKRQASGFETLSPVMGHLHGVIEEGDDSGSGPGARQPIPEGRESKQFVRRGARVLRDWFYRNEECPYPSEEEKARLASETGFTRQRISTWFANARRRSKQQRQAGSSARIYRAGSPMPTPLTQPMPIPMGGTGMLPSTMTPMERWQSSPPDEEPVSEDVIREAIASASGSDGSRPQSQVGTPFTDISSGGEGSLASSLSSFGIPPSDASDSSSSAWSFQSDGNLRARPYSRRPSSGRRGGRRRVADDGHYQCTFCTRSFKKKHDWSRHEKSVHLPLDVWICTPNLDELAQDPSLPPLECRFCENDPPTPEHWESHDFRDCATKPLAERSFSRKDYLWQHLRKFHGCTRYPVSNLDAWKSSQSAIQSRCGFCQESLASWAARTDHLAAHFKEGCRMSQWAGDWGFESAILASLRNAVLPIERGFLDMAA